MESVATCPHCSASARFDPTPALRFCCGVCGGPVVPCDAPRARPDAELAHLVAAQRARAMALGWSAGTLVLALSCVFVASIALLLVAVQAHSSAAILAVVALVAAALGTVAGGRARAQRRRVRESLDLAWQCAAEDVLATRAAHGLQVMSPPELATVLRTNEAHAERLLSALSADGRIRVLVGDDAELAYAAPADEDPHTARRGAT
jgi:hypothetical protein